MTADPESVLSVSELTLQLKQVVESSFVRVAVLGEVVDATTSSSGHIYFVLKDSGAQIRATIWRSTAQRLRFRLEEGQEVICRGAIQLYPPRGTYQLIVNQLEPFGIGAQQLAFQQLFQKLKAEGLFEAEHKKPLPIYTRRIGIVTSPTGAAIHDVIQVIRRRWRDVELFVFPTQVQGEGAPAQIIEAIAAAQRLLPTLEALIVTRGGGSQEDIACFNDERVVRAVFACSIPTISAVGHEIDVTLCDLVADVRALTPSQAGELIVPDGPQIAHRLEQWSSRLRSALRRRADSAAERLAAIASHPILRRPLDRIQLLWQNCDQLGDRMARGLVYSHRRHQTKTAELAARLQAISPIQVLARGYSVTLDENGRPILNAAQVEEGTLIETQLAQGRLQSQVTQRWTSDNLAAELERANRREPPE